MRKIHALIAGLALCSSVAVAEVPGSFKYQMLVRDDSGAVLGGKEVTVRVKFHQDAADGDVLYSETHTATTAQSGIAYLNIGTGTAGASSFTELNWADGPYFMEVEVDKGAGFVSAGTQQLLSVPYAQFAKNAEAVVLTSPDGTQWTVKIDDNGTLSAEKTGK